MYICYAVAKLVNLKLAWDVVGFRNCMSDDLFACAPELIHIPWTILPIPSEIRHFNTQVTAPS